MVPELQHLAQQRLFSISEIREIVKQRTQHEYNIIRRTPYLTDFFRYIQYEVKIELIRRKRYKAQKPRFKLFRNRGPSDYSIIGRTFRIFNSALLKFPNNISLWFQLIDWALSLKSFSQLSKIFPRALRYHPLSTQLWHRAAMYEFEVVGNIENARIYFQRGLRLNPKSLSLWYGFFTMELLYIGRVAKRQVLSNFIPNIERQEQYDRFIKELEREQYQSNGEEMQHELVKKASLLPWTTENSRDISSGDKILLSGRIAQAIYDNACKQFLITDGIVTTVTGLENQHQKTLGLTIKQRLGFLSLINEWKLGREEHGARNLQLFTQDTKEARFQLRKELSLVQINERCLFLAGIDIYSLYKHILLNIFDTIHQAIATSPHYFINDLYSHHNNTVIQTASNQPLVDHSDIASFWDCYARLSLYCEELEFDLPLQLLQHIQSKAPAHRQFSFDINFPSFPQIIPQLEQRALTRYLFGIQVYATFPILADLIPIVLGKLIRFLYDRIKYYFAATTSQSTLSLIPQTTSEHQHLISIGYSLVDFLESILSWSKYQHQYYLQLKFTHNESNNTHITSIPWISNEMYSYWLKLKLLTIKNIPIYRPKTNPSIYSVDILPTFNNVQTPISELSVLNDANHYSMGPLLSSSTTTQLLQSPPTESMLRHQTLYQVFFDALHHIRNTIYNYNSLMAAQLAQTTTNISGQEFQCNNQIFNQQYDESLEKLISMVYLAYVNFILRPHWTVLEGENTHQFRKRLNQQRVAVMNAYTTLFELHTIILSSHFINTNLLSKEQHTKLYQHFGANLAATVNIKPLISFQSISLYWKSFLQLHRDLSHSLQTSQVQTTQQQSQQLFGFLSPQSRISWFLPLIIKTIHNSKFFQPYIKSITAIKLSPTTSHHMNDICIFMHLSSLHYFHLIKEGYMTKNTNLFLPSSSQVSRFTILDILHYIMNNFKTQTIHFCNSLLSQISLNLVLMTNNSIQSASDSSLLPLLLQGIPSKQSEKSLHQKFRLEQQEALKQVIMSSSSESDSNGDDTDGNTRKYNDKSTLLTTNVTTPLSTIQQTIETCMSAIYSPHDISTYNSCLQALINVYKQQEVQFLQFNQLQSTHAPVTTNVIKFQQSILVQLQHRVRKLYLQATRDIGMDDIWIWVHYAQFLSHLQHQCNITTHPGSSSQNRSIITMHNDQLAQYTLELMTELGSVQQSAIKSLKQELRTKFVSAIESLLHK